MGYLDSSLFRADVLFIIFIDLRDQVLDLILIADRLMEGCPKGGFIPFSFHLIWGDQQMLDPGDLRDFMVQL